MVDKPIRGSYAQYGIKPQCPGGPTMTHTAESTVFQGPELAQNTERERGQERRSQFSASGRAVSNELEFRGSGESS
jgi:hypothetical protein